MTTPVKTQGTTVQVKSAADAWVTIACVTGMSGPGGQAAIIDTTTLASTAKEKLIGLPDEGQLTLECVFDYTDVGLLRLLALRASQALEDFQIVFADTGTTTGSFSGYVLGFVMNEQQDDAVRCTFTIEISGAVTFA